MRITATLTAQISDEYSLQSDMTYLREAEAYEGPTTFTPTDQTQTILIAGQTPAENITINPIPSNYGKITWNGSVLTVS